MKRIAVLLAVCLCMIMTGCGGQAQSIAQTAQSAAQSTAQSAASDLTQKAEEKAQQALSSAADALAEKASEQLRTQMEECEAFFEEYDEYMQTFDMDSADLIGVFQYSVYTGKVVDYTNRLEKAIESAVTEDDKAYYEAKKAEIDAIIANIPELKSDFYGNK